MSTHLFQEPVLRLHFAGSITILSKKRDREQEVKKTAMTKKHEFCDR